MLKFKSIKSKLINTACIIFILVATLLSAVSVISTYNSTMSTLELTMLETSKLVASSLEKQLDVFETLLLEIASNPVIYDSKYTNQEKLEFIKAKQAQYKEAMRGDIHYAGSDGLSLIINASINDREYFQKALKGESNLSEPFIRKDIPNALGFAYAVPAKNNGKVVGSVYIIFSYDVILDIVKNVSIGKTGGSYLINSSGDMMVNLDEQSVRDKSNNFEAFKTDPSLKKLVDLQKKAVAGENGFGIYSWKGKQEVMSFSPVPKTNAWSIVTTATRNEFTKGLTISIIASIIISIITSIIAIIIFWIMSDSITKPIKAIVKRMELLASGDTTTEIPNIKTNDEINHLNTSLSKTVRNLNLYIQNISYIMEQLAKGNLNISVDLDYMGDFSPIKQSMTEILNSLNDILYSIRESSIQVSNVSNQISSEAKELSDGVSKQTSIVSEFVSSIQNISENIMANTKNIQQTSNLSNIAKASAVNGDDYVKKMVLAIDEIDNSSKSIAQIIQVIENIANKTNLLALNAAIESARVGEAGKGFAVVASEIRELASKSSETVKDITGIIEQSLGKVTQGKQISKDTSDTLQEILISIEKTADIAEVILKASEDEKKHVSKLSTGINQISLVVGTTASTSEQSAAIVRELVAQSENLNGLVSHFTLRK